MSNLKRIHIHWTAGADGIIPIEADSYNFIVTRDGRVVEGSHPPEAQIPPLRPGKYAAHTLSANSDAIGVAMDAMAAAVERPFSAGRFPITQVQLDSTARFCASLCRKYSIPVSRSTTLTHAEVPITLGIKQRNKWDVTWLPGMDKPGDPLVVGDRIRDLIRGYLR